MRLSSIGVRLPAVAILAMQAAADESLPVQAPAPTAVQNGAPASVDFARDVFPILTQHCLDCHGPDAQEGQLRLDARAAVLAGGVSGPAVSPGKSAESVLVRRITGQGGQDRMPLDAEPLSETATAAIKAWIDRGAVWPDDVGVRLTSAPQHWAYVKPDRPRVPDVTRRAWPRNSIDTFVLARLEAAGLEPSPGAPLERLLRRVTFDLTGAPPRVEDLDEFLADDDPAAFEKAVDRLLASPRYGERWAVPWLDAARYADSNGYQRDGRREAWAWRDWVIRALNSDMPFDRFTIEQMAGDLLPEATLDQRIATGFHRNTMANVEAGTDPEEEHVLAVIDRVNTTGAVWLGATLECAQCHSHKYDPFSQREYYQLYAFFNNTAGEIVANGSNREFTGPAIDLPLAAAERARRDRLQVQVDELNRQIAEVSTRLDERQPDWEREVASSGGGGGATWTALEPLDATAEEGTALARLDDHSLLASGDFPDTDVYRVTARTSLAGITAFRLEILTDPSLPGGGPGRVPPGNFILSEFGIEIADAARPQEFATVEVASVAADYAQPRWPVTASIDGNRKTGWAIGKQFGVEHHAVFSLKAPVGSADGSLLRFTLDQQYGSTRTIGRFRLLATTGDPEAVGLPADVREIVLRPADKRSRKQARQLRDYHLAQSDELKDLQAQLKSLEAARDAIQPDTTLVMQELAEPRMTHMFKRGDFLNPGESVEPGTPRVLHDLPADNARPDRLALGRWLVAPENPLTARVTVNRHWAELFGRGLVETLEDFGTQGARPTHPELLDWLAVELVEGKSAAEDGRWRMDDGEPVNHVEQSTKDEAQSTADDDSPLTTHRSPGRGGWSLKRLHRLLVTSATYRQSARVAADLLERDPYNALYARGPRTRLPAEFVRDNALAVAGLLSQKLHGPPVFPYQPAGVWNHIGRASNVWPTSEGDDRYRRGLYVYWRRTVPYPSFVNFDAPTRETCAVQRSRSNTPLQALTLLNDPAYLEAAVAFAVRLVTEPSPGAPPADRVEWAFREAASRRPLPREIAILVERFETEASRYRRDPAAAKPLLGDQLLPPEIEPAELAAWVHVANILLNLDEVISR